MHVVEDEDTSTVRVRVHRMSFVGCIAVHASACVLETFGDGRRDDDDKDERETFTPRSPSLPIPLSLLLSSLV